MCHLLQEMDTCSVTTDGWVDEHRHVAYVCITLHYMDSKWQLHSHVLSTRQMEEAHTAENIFAEVSAVLEVSNRDNYLTDLPRLHPLKPMTHLKL